VGTKTGAEIAKKKKNREEALSLPSINVSLS
jgi:hypothetical protein